MKTFQYKIRDEIGIHARPAGLLVKEAKQYKSKVTLKVNGKEAEATKLMAVMGLGVKNGQTVEVIADGEDENTISLPEDLDYSDAISLTVELMKISYLMDLRDDINMRMEQAHNLLEQVYSHKEELMGLIANETASELLFTSLATGRRELAQQLYTDELKRYIDTYKSVMSSKERCLWAVAYYLDDNKEEADKIYNSMIMRCNDFLMQGEVKMDIKLIERLLESPHRA